MSAPAAAAPNPVANAIDRALLERLVSERLTAVVAHVILFALFIALIGHHAPRWFMVGWGGAIVAAFTGRLAVGNQVRRAQLLPATSAALIRLSMAALGLAWGIGAAAALGFLSASDAGLVLLGLTGLLAGGLATLVADRWTFALYGFAMFAPVAVAVAHVGPELFDELGVLLIVIYLGFTIRLQQRAYTALRNELVSARALAESEDRFRTFFEESPVGNSITDPDGALLRVNQAFCKLLGYSVKEMQQLSWPAITHPDDLAESREAQRALLSGATDNWQMEKRYRTRSGEWVWTLVSIGIHQKRDDNPAYFITHVQDISARKRAEEQIRTLEGILPICASCKRIKNDDGAWQQLESYVRDHSKADFSHGLCPDCARRDWGT